MWLGEIKWSDRVQKNEYEETKAIRHPIRNHKTITDEFFTTKTYSGTVNIESIRIVFVPTAIYCYTIGRNVTSSVEVGGIALNNPSQTEAA
jgi:uncharacterized protein